MLNKEQLDKLNEIFHREIVPVFDKNPEAVDALMKKIDEYHMKREDTDANINQ